MVVDATREWIGVIRGMRQAGQVSPPSRDALVASQWRRPRSPFMQQASELNINIRTMHNFLLEHFLDYVDIHSSLPSQKSLMTEEEKDLIDLEVTSFMTACAAGVDALKALLQRERIRRMEQHQALGDNSSEDEGLSGPAWEDSGRGLPSDSRLAHQNTTVTYLFERLQAVTAVAQTMQNERQKQVAARKIRFYAGPSGGRVGKAPNYYSLLQSSATNSVKMSGLTPEEEEEEALFRRNFPVVYGNAVGVRSSFSYSSDKKNGDGGDGMGIATGLRGGGGDGGTESWLGDKNAGNSMANETAATAVTSGARDSVRRRPLGEGRVEEATKEEGSDASIGERSSFGRRGGAAGDRRDVHSRTGTGTDSFTVLGGAKGSEGTGGPDFGSGAGSGSKDGIDVGGGRAVSAEQQQVLEGENRDLLARLENELDDARLVESKMTEISGLMGLFASKVMEQQGDLEHVFDAAVSTNHKLVRGGEHLERAVERGASFRQFYVMFMLGASLCLLFLHWYMP